MSLESEKYQFITSMQKYHDEKIGQAFRMYVTLSSSIVAGSLWLLSQDTGRDLFGQIKFLAIVLIVIACIASSTLIWFNLDGWYGFRLAECKMDSESPTPKPMKSRRGEILMIVIEVIATVVTSGGILYAGG